MSRFRPLPARALRFSLVASLSVTLTSGCADAPTGAEGPAALDLRPTFALAAAPFAAAPIDRISLRVVDAETLALVGSADVEADPAADQWTLPIGVDLGGESSRSVLVELELLAGSAVQWSGRAGPFTVTEGTPSAPRLIDVYRGPLDNLDVQSVEILGAPDQLGVEGTAALSAELTLAPGSDAAPVVFWASSDSSVATVTREGPAATVTAVAPGMIDIIAGAGPAMDTVSVEVLIRPLRIWVGGAAAGATDWSSPGNWNPVGVPTASDDVRIDDAAFEPVLSGDVAVENLTVVGEATIDLNGFTLTVHGDLDGDLLGGATALNGLTVVAGPGQLVDGGFDDLRVDAARVLADRTEIAGELQLNAAPLDVDGHQLTVSGGLVVGGPGAALVMQSAAGVVDVAGSATFDGASEEGLLAAGTLTLAGDLAATASSPTSFAATSQHMTRFVGPTAQTVSFANPGSAGHRLHNVMIDEAATVTMATDATIGGAMTVNGAWTVPDGTVTTIEGALTLESGALLTVNGVIAATGGCTNLGATLTGSGTHPCSSFDPGLGALVAIAFDPVGHNLFVHHDFATVIHEYTQSGVEVLPTIPSPAPTSNDYDLDFMSLSGNVGGTDVPANTLLVINGEVAPGALFAIDKDDGTVLASMALPGGNPVGGAYHSVRTTLFVVDWTTDTIMEVELDTGATLATFPVAPAGSPAFDVFYGDIAVDPATGHLVLVSSSQNTVRVLTPTGAFVRDIPVGGLGLASMSGIGWDPQTGTAWIATTGGDIHRVSGLDVTAPTSRSTLNPPGEVTFEARTSHTRTGSATILMFDDLYFGGGSTLQAVAWQGIYCREVADAPAPVPVATSFTVSFHADLAGVPDTTTTLYSETLPVAQVAETLERNEIASCGVTASTTWGLYDYSATLTTPFAAAAGTRYWLSIVGNLPSTDLYWGWRGGTPDNADSRQLIGGSFTTITRDRAFSLEP